MDGAAMERQLANAFETAGWAVLRAPASGSATARELPDIFAGNGEIRYAIELKTSSDDRAYVTDREVDDLMWFADRMAARPRLVARWSRDTTFYAYHPGVLHITAGGNYRLHRDDRKFGMAIPAGTDDDP